MVSSGGENLEIYNITNNYGVLQELSTSCKPLTSLTNPSTPIKIYNVISYGYKHMMAHT